jgi:hypothetical protein
MSNHHADGRPRIVSCPLYYPTFGAAGLALWLLSSLSGQTTYPGLVVTFLAGTLAIVALLFSLVACVFGRVTADADGLRWRDWRGWHDVPWEDVTDYYDELPAHAPGRTERVRNLVVVARGGDILRFNPHWLHAEKLRSRIAERAVNATPVNALGQSGLWMAHGARPADFPRTFAYLERDLKRERWQAATTTVIVCCLFLAPSVWMTSWLLGMMDANLARMVYLFTRQTSLAVAFTLLSLLPLGFVVPFLWHFFVSEGARRDTRARSRRGESLVATADGLTFYEDGEGRFAPWESVVGYHFGSALQSKDPLAMLAFYVRARPCHVRTTDGKRFVVTNRISGFPLLQYLLRRYATEAVEEQWEENNREALGGVAARWTGGEEGKGDRVFSMRTRNLRNALVATIVGSLFLLIAAADVVVVSDDMRRKGVGADEIAFLVLAMVPLAILCTVGLALIYWKNRVTLGAAGLTDYGLGGSRFVPWAAVRKVESVSGTLWLEVEGEKPLAIRPAAYAYGSEIARHIEEYRRPHSRRSVQADV